MNYKGHLTECVSQVWGVGGDTNNSLHEARNFQQTYYSIDDNFGFVSGRQDFGIFALLN
jgi:hypothetical protein